MTPVQIDQARALGRCTFAPGTTAKRFVRWVSQEIDPGQELSAKASAFLNRLAHSYRKQIGRCMAVDCEKCAVKS